MESRAQSVRLTARAELAAIERSVYCANCERSVRIMQLGELGCADDTTRAISSAEATDSAAAVRWLATDLPACSLPLPPPEPL